MKEGHENSALNGSLGLKHESRQQQRNQARDQNRPNLVMNISSPEYEVLSTSFEADESLDDEADDKAAFVRRSLNESFKHIKHREKWQNEQKRARRKHFEKNRRPSSDSSRLQVKSRGPTELESADDLSQFQSCSSLNSDTANEIFFTPKKGITRNFFMMNHSEVNRLSDIYVRPVSSLASHNNNAIENDVTWLDIKSFVAGFFFAFATVFKSLFTRKD